MGSSSYPETKEQVDIRSGRHGGYVAVGQHELESLDRINCKSMLICLPRVASTQNETSYTNSRRSTTDNADTMRFQCGVYVIPDQTSSNGNGLRIGIIFDLVCRRLPM